MGDLSLDYNDGPRDSAGPDEPSWDAFLGDYEIDTWGRPSQKLSIRGNNGYLYLDATRLIVEFEPGLFFTSDGEAVDFRSENPTWRNIALRRVT